MRFIETFREGNHISDVYLCKTKQIALTKNGKEYGSLVLQDKTGRDSVPGTKPVKCKTDPQGG